jgi:hypothetical protein
LASFNSKASHKTFFTRDLCEKILELWSRWIIEEFMAKIYDLTVMENICWWDKDTSCKFMQIFAAQWCWISVNRLAKLIWQPVLDEEEKRFFLGYIKYPLLFFRCYLIGHRIEVSLTHQLYRFFTFIHSMIARRQIRDKVSTLPRDLF